MKNRGYLFLAIMLVLNVNAVANQSSHISKQERQAMTVVSAFVDGFNQHSPEVMFGLSHNDLLWMYVQDADLAVETKGRESLKKSMVTYFSNYPKVHSTMLNMSANGDYVSGTEKVAWYSGGKHRSQCSSVVYQLRDLKVFRVWYFPPYDC